MKKRIFAVIAVISLLFSACSKTLQIQPITTNTPVTIAVIDTGFSSAAIPQQNIFEDKNYLDETIDTESPNGISPSQLRQQLLDTAQTLPDGEKFIP